MVAVPSLFTTPVMSRRPSVAGGASVSGMEGITYALDFRARGPGQGENKTFSSDSQRSDSETAGPAIPRIARLMALAIRFDRLLRAEEFRNYAEIARLGRVTRARMTQIMKLLNLAPDIQEQILFLPHLRGLNERNLRPIVNQIDWKEQRLLFRKIVSVPRGGEKIEAFNPRC
jgi:hypothetical protein